MIQSVNVFNMDLEPVLVADRHPKNASMMKLFETTKKKVLVAKNSVNYWVTCKLCGC